MGGHPGVPFQFLVLHDNCMFSANCCFGFFSSVASNRPAWPKEDSPEIHVATIPEQVPQEDAWLNSSRFRFKWPTSKQPNACAQDSKEGAKTVNDGAENSQEQMDAQQVLRFVYYQI